MRPKLAIDANDRIHSAYFALRAPLGELFNAMDAAYKLVAEKAGFVCSGCPENCCRSRFYHHTYLEYFYLQEGFNRLESARRSTAMATALGIPRSDPENSIPNRPLCPLHLKGLCSIYPYRPLICRLHGVPHKLQQSASGLLCGPGCATFEREHRSPNNIRLDRTPYYRQMARLENRFRQTSGLTRKIKMTIAEMMVSFSDEIYPY